MPAILKTLFAALVPWLFCWGVAVAQQPEYPQPDETDRVAIERVIRDQLDAFRRDDGAAAFAYAAPAIRGKFGTPERFMRMVRESFGALYRPQFVRFLPPAIIGGATVQAVQVAGDDGNLQVALYWMERQPDGQWRIQGCEMAPSTHKLL